VRIYVASSWRNARQQTVVRALRAVGHSVYDFREPTPGANGFAWDHVACAEALRDPKRFRDEVLTNPIALRGYGLDKAALDGADAVVLVLPCGRSAHLELGYACGSNRYQPERKTCVLLDEPLSEPELMYLMVDRLCTSIEEVVEFLGEGA
jgi:hypothetical protein